MRPKSKIERYIEKLMGSEGIITESEKSRYYTSHGRTIRISDHIGKTSDGSISIIFDDEDPKEYIVHSHIDGRVIIVNYRNLQTIVKAFVLLSSMFLSMRIQPLPVVTPKQPASDEETILGIPISKIPPRRLNHIKQQLKNIK